MRIWIAIAIVLAAVRVDAKPVDPPRELLASVAIGPDASLDNLRAFANAIKPGAGAALTTATVHQGVAQLVGASSLAGLDAAGWMQLLVFDDGTTKHLALVARVSDAEVNDKQVATAAAPSFTMIKDRWALIGEKPIVEKLAPFAFGTLAAQPQPTLPGATVYVPALLARYKTQLAAARTQMIAASAATQGGNPAMAQMMASYFDGIMSMLTDSERIVITLEASKDLGAVDLAFVPRANSRLAKFIAAQKPTDYALFDKLPATAAPILLGGHLEMGPYRDGLLAVMTAMYGANGDPTAFKDVVDATAAVMKASTGDFAMTMTIAPGKGMSVNHLFALADAPGADKAIAHVLSLLETARSFDMGKIKTTVKTDPVSPTHDGITLRGYDIVQDLSKLTPAERAPIEKMIPGGIMAVRIATFDGLGMVAFAPSSITEAKHTIDAVRGKGTRYKAPAVIGDLLAASKKRKESVAFVLDIGGIMAMFAPGSVTGVQAILMSCGFADKTAHLRFSVPTSTIAALAKVRP